MVFLGVLLPLLMAGALMLALMLDDSRPPVRPAHPSRGAARSSGETGSADSSRAASRRWTKAR